MSEFNADDVRRRVRQAVCDVYINRRRPIRCHGGITSPVISAKPKRIDPWIELPGIHSRLDFKADDCARSVLYAKSQLQCLKSDLWREFWIREVNKIGDLARELLAYCKAPCGEEVPPDRELLVELISGLVLMIFEVHTLGQKNDLYYAIRENFLRSLHAYQHAH